MGYDNGMYGPNDAITREQLVVILWRYAGRPESMGSLDGFTDSGKTNDYAVPALQWAVEQKIVAGRDDGLLSPQDNVSRAEVATILMNYCQLVK